MSEVNTNECRIEGHTWIIELSEGWRHRVQFLNKSIKVPVICNICKAKGTEYWKRYLIEEDD